VLHPANLIFFDRHYEYRQLVIFGAVGVQVLSSRGYRSLTFEETCDVAILTRDRVKPNCLASSGSEESSAFAESRLQELLPGSACCGCFLAKQFGVRIARQRYA